MKENLYNDDKDMGFLRVLEMNYLNLIFYLEQ